MNSKTKKIILMILTIVSICSCNTKPKNNSLNGIWISNDPNKSVLCAFDGNLILSDDSPFLIHEIKNSQNNALFFSKDKNVYNKEDFNMATMIILPYKEKNLVICNDNVLNTKNIFQECVVYEPYKLKDKDCEIEYLKVKINIRALRLMFMDFPFEEVLIKSNKKTGDPIICNNRICGNTQLLYLFNRMSLGHFDSIYLGNSYLPGSASFSIEIKEFEKPIKLINIHGFDYSIPVELRIVIQTAILNAYLFSS